MNPQELRIGNYVDVINRSGEIHLPHNIIKKVGRIEFFKVDLYNYDEPFVTQELNWTVDIADLSPIPLTPDLLERFGFKRLGDPNKDNYNGNADLNFGYPVLEVGQGNHITQNCSVPNGYLFFEGHRIDCKYAHQLQNLFFALTGTELTLNPKS